MKEEIYSTSIWKFIEENAKGQTLEIQKGGKTSTFVYNNKGMPTSMQASGIVNLTYGFEDQGNLSFRQDNLTNQKEMFVYDGMNRLTNWDIYQNNSLVKQNSLTYNSTTGNIQTKSDIGNYTMNYGEGNGKPHALTSISGVPTNFPTNDLNVTYTDFKKIKTLTEGSKNYTITYGIDDQRRKSVYKENNTTKETRYYLGNYEEKTDHTTGITEKIHYLSGAIYVERSNGTKLLYYAYTDYLGSLIALTNEAGTVVERYAYDPWGERRNPTDWTQTDTRTSWLINRGYTMHEHLSPFGGVGGGCIINMNGRVYDPLTASFFSPDPFVQAPDNWLNYNRYAYAYGNPFKYTDPDGEWVHLVVGAVIGGTVNLIANWKKVDNFWQGLGYFGIGAAAGALGAGVGAGISSAIAGGSFGAGFIGSSGALTATTSFWSGAAIGGGSGFSSGFTSGFGNGLMQGQNFGQALWSGTKTGLIAGASGAAIGGLVGGIGAARQGRDFWDGFDYQKTLDDVVAREGINNPNSKFLVANKKNARLVNETFNGDITKVRGNKIFMSTDGSTYSEYGVNFGTQSKGNLTLISKQVIRDKAFFSLTDVVRHEGTHQVQILAGMTARNFAAARAMEYGAYMTNILNPATSTTIQKVFNVLVNDWGINHSTLWETILNLYPYGPIP